MKVVLVRKSAEAGIMIIGVFFDRIDFCDYLCITSRWAISICQMAQIRYFRHFKYFNICQMAWGETFIFLEYFNILIYLPDGPREVEARLKSQKCSLRDTWYHLITIITIFIIIIFILVSPSSPSLLSDRLTFSK